MKKVKAFFLLMNRLFYSPADQAKRAGVVMGDNNMIASHFWSAEPYLITIGSHCQITGGG